MKLPLFHHEQTLHYRRPKPANMPDVPNTYFFAVYRGARTGGDFYDFCWVNGRVLTLFCDVSGRRDEALNIAAALQDKFQSEAPVLFSPRDLNESERLSELVLLLNREIIETAGGPRYTPAFISCFDHESGMLTYINAGHLPALLRDRDGISTLDATGLPLGLFTHSTHDAHLSVLGNGSSMLLVSRGVVETKRHHEEFGLQRVKEKMLASNFLNAQELCSTLQNAAQNFLENGAPENDLTTLAIVRPSTMTAEAAS